MSFKEVEYCDMTVEKAEVARTCLDPLWHHPKEQSFHPFCLNRMASNVSFEKNLPVSPNFLEDILPVMHHKGKGREEHLDERT